MDIFGHKRAKALHHARRPPQRRERIGMYPDGGVFFDHGLDEHLGTWRLVYEQGLRPTSGAMGYAYMSCAPVVVSPCGPGFDVQGPGWSGLQPPPLYSTQAAALAGVALQAGSVYSMPLTVPPMASKGV